MRTLSVTECIGLKCFKEINYQMREHIRGLHTSDVSKNRILFLRLCCCTDGTA